MNKTLQIIIAGLILVNSSNCFADATATKAELQWLFTEKVPDVLGKIDAGSDLADVNSTQDRFRTTLGDDKKEVTFELGDLFHGNNGHYFNLQATLPLESDKSSKLLGDLDTLSNKAQVKFSWQKVGVPKLNQHANITYKTLLACYGYANSKPPAVRSAGEIAILAFDPRQHLQTLLTKSDAESHVWIQNIDQHLLPADLAKFLAADHHCSASLVDDNDTYRMQFREAVFVESPSYLIYGADATIANDNFTYFEQNDLSNAKKSNETDYKANIFAGRMFGSNSYLGVSLSYEDAHTNSDELEVCVPLGSDGALSCGNKRIGAPKQSDSTKLSVDYSKRFGGYGVQFKVTRDLDSDVTGLAIPVWLSRDKSGLFNGGFRLDWNSEDDEVTASFFFNTPFNFGL